MSLGVTAAGRTAKSGVPTAILKGALEAIAMLDTLLDILQLIQKRCNISVICQEA